jgi:N-acetylneuraminate synthase/N,N'-diacetyllegionaminate synthase
MERFRIGKRVIGGPRVYVIAEIGSNHDGKLPQARRLIDLAARAGADAVKFQTFRADRLYPPLRFAADGTTTPHPTHEFLKHHEVPHAWHAALKARADARGVDFLSTPFDEDAADLLVAVGCPALKIASGDLTHHALLRHVARTKTPVLLSTGMATLGEIDAAVGVLRGSGCRELALLHCVSNYPPDFAQVNVRAVETLRRAFACPVGQSDHSLGVAVPLAAVTLGASLVEKHLTLSRRLSGPDHPYAMEPEEFAAMVREIRNLEQALGDGRKVPAKSEVPERTYARRGVYARRDLAAGETLATRDLAALRPAVGLGAEALDQVVGRKVRRAVRAWEAIGRKDLA